MRCLFMIVNYLDLFIPQAKKVPEMRFFLSLRFIYAVVNTVVAQFCRLGNQIIKPGFYIM